MKKESLIAAVLTLFLLACLNGVEGQYTTTQPGAVGQITPYQTTAVQPAQYMTLPSGYETTAPMTTATATTASQYAQYYTTGPAPNAHITAPQSFNIGANVPSTVYVGTQMQAMPYPQYYATYTGGNSLWIRGSTSWTQYASVPQGSILSLLASSPTGGEGALYETYPDGKVTRSDYYFYPTSLIGFYADTPGRHMLYFVLAGQPSNQIVIDVVGTYKPPVYYTPLPTHYAGYYPYYWDSYYYPYYWDYYPYYWDHHRDVDHHQEDGDNHQGDGDNHQGDGSAPSPPPNQPPHPPHAGVDLYQGDGSGPSPPSNLPPHPPHAGVDLQQR